jgi:predicted ATPase/DNA-binding SARP family transcriptional activator
MLEVKLLGQFQVLRDGRRLSIPARNAQSLFAYLLLYAGKAFRREKLAGLLWPESSEDNARSNLRHELWRLRKALETDGDSYFIIDDLEISFNPQSDYSLDVQQLESVPLESSTTGALIKALSSYQGELLPGFYNEWVFVERERLYNLFEIKITRLLESLESEGRWEEVLDWAMRWISISQWPEPAYRALIIAYANSGDMSKAAVTYERLTEGLQKDLGVKPSEQTQALYKWIKTGWKPEASKKTPVWNNQNSLSSTKKSTPTFALPKGRRSNLPTPLTSFIGREKEIQQVQRLVSGAKLVTVTGSGGVGKTRLAIQVASALAVQFRDGVWWVELASLSASAVSRQRELVSQHREATGDDLVIQAVEKALRVPETPDLPIIEGILEYLNDKQLLLVLDNCEHLIEATAYLAERILSNCPQISILATSREALGVPGEKAWLLPSLSLPGGENSADFRNIFLSEAVSLLIERAGDILPGYQPGGTEAPYLAQICLRLDGIPLAIELAAARMNLLSVQEIAARLDRRFSLLTDGSRTALPRHHTLLAAIEWSHDLLSEPERFLFRRLSIFAGSFTLEAVEAICASQEIQGDEMLSLLGRLVDKSLLKVESASQDPDLATRYRMLETIHSYGQLKLEEAEETNSIRNRHAEYYVGLVEAIEAEFLSQNQVRWYRLLQAENDNLRAVVAWGSESDQAECALRLVGALLWFWTLFNSPREGRDLAIQALSTPSATRFRDARARALNTAGFAQIMLGDIASARKSLEEALMILKTSDDQASLAWSMQFLGMLYTFEKKFDLADTAIQEGLTIAKRLMDLRVNGFLFFQGDIELQKGDLTRAKTIYEESAAFQREMGNKSFLAYPLRRLGYLALAQGELTNAGKYFQESLTSNWEIGDKPGLAACLTSFAALAILLDQPVMAARLFGVVENFLETRSIKLFYLDQAELELVSCQLQNRLDKATFEEAYIKGWELSDEQAILLTGMLLENSHP